MDHRRFDSLTRSLAGPKTRRGLLGGLAAFAAAALGANAQVPCPPGQTRNKKGDCNCPAGTDACPDGCFNRKTDPNHCGSCGAVCGGGEVCQKGECRCPRGATCCPPGLSLCAGACVDLTTDLDNCGACGSGCAHDDPCISTACTPEGTCLFTFLSGGACTTEGGAGGTCSAGLCVATTGTTPPPVPTGAPCTATDQCATGLCCVDVCVDTANDGGNCGACGNPCPQPDNSTGNCSGGECSFVCNPGYAWNGAECAAI